MNIAVSLAAFNLNISIGKKIDITDICQVRTKLKNVGLDK